MGLGVAKREEISLREGGGGTDKMLLSRKQSNDVCQRPLKVTEVKRRE